VPVWGRYGERKQFPAFGIDCFVEWTRSQGYAAAAP